MNQIFSEVYGCYFKIVSLILERAKRGITKDEIDEIVCRHGFSETAFHLLPRLIGGEWKLLEKRGDFYYSKLSGRVERPLTSLELGWLSALLNDPRIGLFLSVDRQNELRAALKGVTPLFDEADFIAFDRHRDGDPYDDPHYALNFRAVLRACKRHDPVEITYDSERTGRTERNYHSYKLSYSELNDKFRLLCAVFNPKTQKLNRVTLNCNRIVSVRPSSLPYRVGEEALDKLYCEPYENPPMLLEITKERNALERFLLQFSSFDRKTEYDQDRGIYVCRLCYDTADEAELLIRILSFGPTIKVLSPQSVVDQIKERIADQLRLFDNRAEVTVTRNHEVEIDR